MIALILSILAFFQHNVEMKGGKDVDDATKSEAKTWAIAHQYTIIPEDITLLIIFYICADKCKNKISIDYIETILYECGMNDIVAMLRKGSYSEALLLYKKLYYTET